MILSCPRFLFVRSMGNIKIVPKNPFHVYNEVVIDLYYSELR